MSEQLTLTFENGTSIKWVHGLDGGGSTQYKDFLSYLKIINRKYTHCLEWCAGLGAIGYSILDSGICNQLSMMDLYEPAKEWAMINAHTNNVPINFYLGNTVSKIPNGIKFDLVVANPPHCMANDYVTTYPSASDDEKNIITRLTVDENWMIHQDFFDNIYQYLDAGADVILSETGSHTDLIKMAEKNGLKFIRSVAAPALIECSSPYAVLMHFKYEKEIY